MTSDADEANYELLTYEHVVEGVVTVCFNRPDKRNAFNDTLGREFAAAMRRFDDDERANVAVLTGAGAAFTAGRDIFENSAAGKLTLEPPDLAGETNPFWTPIGGVTYVRTLRKPVIAAINGYAFGTGVFLALAADLCLASKTAIFELSEIHRGHLGGWQLGYQYGLSRSAAMELALGRRITARRAYDMGWVNEVTASEDLMPTAIAWASEIAALSQPAVAAHRALVDEAWPAVAPDLDAKAERMRQEIAALINADVAAAHDWRRPSGESGG